MLRSFALGFASLACAAVAAALVAGTACLSAPPPDLPVPPLLPPTILHDAVQPPEGVILTKLPQQFIVPVRLASADEAFQYDAYVDYAACSGFTCPGSVSPYVGPTTVTPTPGTLDGGVYVQDFAPPVIDDSSQCDHTIQFLVAHAFNAGAEHTWDSVGGDIVTWHYNPSGNAISCTYDAGSLQDGAFPPADAPSDGLPVTPQDGGGDP